MENVVMLSIIAYKNKVKNYKILYINKRQKIQKYIKYNINLNQIKYEKKH